MPSPFPGMDPYLETPDLWGDVHHGVISQTQAALNRKVRPKYIARVELRVYVEDENDPGRKERIPDVRIETGKKRPNGHSTAIKTFREVPEPIIAEMPFTEIEEAYLTIKHRATGTLVTVIEVLSPSNKIENSAARKSFLEKRSEVMASDVHWVEIDLLRKGVRIPSGPSFVKSDYRVLVSRADPRWEAKYWPTSVRQRLPVIGIPLRGKDPDAPLDLGKVLNTAYDVAGYDDSVDYTIPPEPPLSPADTKWANQLLKSKGLR